MDLIEVRISDISLTNVGFAVFLKPKDIPDAKVVPIFIGPLETHSITSVLEGVTPPRPMTHDLLMQIVQSVGTQIVKITIDEIIDNTFFAKIYLRKDEEILILDARPSDSIAIALRAGSPMYITQNVLNEAGIVMKEDMTSEKIQEVDKPTTPKTRLQILEETLSNAIKSEDYETAAKIRDQIKKIIESS
ncbi:MAG: bifunctional nuclease family protein [Leptospiraceae bacterium]|nr:bifunctional nuclease family protein [Leptospiraceae bacterium]